jgi:hypothetical protein
MRNFALVSTPFALLIWFFPGWLYRITLKSTAWLWWPIAFLGSQPRLAKNPEWFHSQITETRWARHLRVFAYISVFIFFVTNVWNAHSDQGLPDNPFLNVVGYALVINWAATPWQLLGVTGSLLSVGILYAIDWAYRKSQAAKATNDSLLEAEALRQFGWIERLSRIRSLLFICYCGAVGLQAILVFDARSCWFVPASSIQRLADSLYGNKVPINRCATMSSTLGERDKPMPSASI